MAKTEQKDSSSSAEAQQRSFMAVSPSPATIDFDGQQTRGTWATRPVALPEGLKTTLATESLFDDDNHTPGYQLDIDDVRILQGDDEVFAGPPQKALAGR